MAKNKKINLSSIDKLEIKFTDCSRGTLCIKRLCLSKRSNDIIRSNLNEIETQMFNQIMNCQDVGSFMLVIIGLRSIVESLTNKVCINEKISTEIYDEKEKRIKKLTLKEKYKKIEGNFSKKENAKLFLDIIETANDTIHELENKLQRNSSDKYIRDFIKLLDSESIFVEKEAHVNFIRNWVKKNSKSKNHLLRTGFWLKEIYKNPSDSMMIAAIGHDIERSFSEKGEKRPLNLDWDNEDYLLWHGRRSARFLRELLLESSLEEKTIKEIESLVINHEIGGNVNSDAVKDADSISFLENNYYTLIKDVPRKFSKERAKKKLDFMYNRITSEKAKQIAKPFYERAIEKLNKK
jgi:hypothetical protein